MTTFRIGPAPQQDLSSSQSLQRGTHLALQPAIQPIQPAANAQPAFQPVTQALGQATTQPAFQPITQVLGQATAQPALQPITQVLQQPTAQTDLQPITRVLQQANTQTDLQAVTPALQPVIFEQSVRPTTPDISQQGRQLVDQEPQAFEEADMSQQLYQIQGQDGPIFVDAAQLQALQLAAAQPQTQQYIAAAQPQQYVAAAQPQQYIIQQPNSRPNSVYYTQGALPGQQIITPGLAPVANTAVAPVVATTTAHGVPVVTQPQKDDDMLSFYDPSWYKKQSTAGSLTGSTLAWLVFAFVLLVLLLHVIAFGMPYWSWFQIAGIDISVGLWQACDNILGCRTPEYRISATLLNHLKTSQALAGVILAGLIILAVLYLIFLATTQHKTKLEILIIVVSFITAILMLSLLSVWEVNIRKPLSTSTHGGSYIVEIIAFVFLLLIPIIATIDYVLVTRKM